MDIKDQDMPENMPEKEESRETEHFIKLRNLTREDFPDIADTMRAGYSINDSWREHHIAKLVELFPEGQIGIEDKGRIVAFVLSIIVDYKKFGDTHTYKEITGNYTFSTHDPKGDVLYGLEVCVHPDFRDMRLGRRLYDARKELCEELELQAIVAGGRMPNYNMYAEKLSPRQYIEKVKRKEIYDPVLTFQQNNDFHVKKVLKNYLPMDTESNAYATLIEWNNIYYAETQKPLVERKKIVVRLGLVQWQMRPLTSLQNLFDTMEFFVDAVSGYQADFILFPEFFNAALMADYNELEAPIAIRKLASYTKRIRDIFIELAVSYNVNIIAGSMPLYENERLYNVSYLCRRDGTWDIQYKIHPTPDEVSEWGMQGGHELKVFETDVAKVGILICYDCEFPELPRYMADQGMEILFVPFLTDTHNGYHRVRKCAEARAVENECYVAVAGSVGNLPKVKNMDIQYAQSSVVSPCDFPFPSGGIIAETTPNTEMTIIADVDLDLLKELHNHGSVNNLLDRRKDLYEVVWKGNNKNKSKRTK